MCLAIPGKILSIKESNEPMLREGRVSFGGIVKQVNLSMVPEANLEDYVLVHVGVAIKKINEEEARKTLQYLNPQELEEIQPDV